VIDILTESLKYIQYYRIGAYYTVVTVLHLLVHPS